MDKIWLSQYQQGVPSEINLDSYASLVDIFNESCRKYKDKVAYVNMGSELTFAELDQLSQRFASYLQQLGLTPGARIAIMMPNLLQYPIVLFAILRAGYIVVNTNPLYTPDELTHQLRDSGAEVIIVMANFAHVVERSLPHTPALKHVVITQMGDVFSLIKRFIINVTLKYIKKMLPAYKIPQAITFHQALQRGCQLAFKPVPLTHQDIAFIQYTGGTTGVAKGAVLTHGNMVANVLQASAWIQVFNLDAQDTIITALPLYHIFSLTANCLTFLKAGAKNILITNPRDITHFIKQIKNTQFTAITGVNTLFNALLSHRKFKEIDFSHLKLALSGGMSLQKTVALQWYNRTKAPILEAYGLTETSPAVTINPMYLTEYNGSIGLPLPSTEISIRDTAGHEVKLGEAGELCVKGPQVMAGYWQRPDETALVFWPDGFLRTGDSVKMDAKGYVYIVDRIKDLILVSGFNVYPNEIEHVISQMPEVQEVGVVGVEMHGTEKVKACIVKRDPALTAEQVIAFSREHLTAYKVPKIVEFYPELPKTNVGKVLRRALR